MDRRRFLKTGLKGAFAAPAILLRPRRAAGADPEEKAPRFTLEEATIARLQEDQERGRSTARAIAQSYLDRIREIDGAGPALRSVIEVNPEALAIAAALDEERKAKGPRGPLHGIPVLLKDNLDTADRMATTAGSLALEGAAPPRDSTVADRLRRAGAVILGKTNLSEWANIRSRRSTSGWSARGGLTRNPYALDRNPCGSSSGSAVAVAANLCAAAIGTETNGSIVCPSSINGVVGIKPTVGLVSRAGIIPISHTQDTAGPMARTVADAAVLLGALAGADPRDSITQESAGKSPGDYRQFLDPAGLKGARLGVPRKFFGFNRRVDALIESALEEMRRQGATLVDPADLPSQGRSGGGEMTVLLYELKADLNAYLDARGAAVKSLREVIEFNERNRERELPYFGQENFLEAEAKGPLTTPEYREALEKIRRRYGPEGIDAVLDGEKLDALVAPTTGPAWTTDLVHGDHSSGGGCSTPAAVAGYPHLTLPLGFVFGLPVGISFFGRAYSEPVLIRLAHAFEQATRHRRPPRFLPSADLGG